MKGFTVKAPKEHSKLYKERYRKILGELGIVRKIGILFGRNESTVARWFINGVPFYVVVNLELLEVAPKYMRDAINSRITKEFYDMKHEDKIKAKQNPWLKKRKKKKPKDK